MNSRFEMAGSGFRFFKEYLNVNVFLTSRGTPNGRNSSQLSNPCRCFNGRCTKVNDNQIRNTTFLEVLYSSLRRLAAARCDDLLD